MLTDLGGAPALDEAQVIERRNASARLARQVVPGGAVVVNVDEPQAELVGAVNLDARRVTFGLGHGVATGADVSAVVDRLDHEGSRIRLLGFDREATVDLRVPGLPAVRHALAAAAVAWSRGVDVRAVVEGLETVAELPGRLDRVDEGQPFEVMVDAACHGAELQEALVSVRSITRTPGRVHCVVGAEGNRPAGRDERLGLARAAEALADRVTFTNDNPRTEPADQILDDLLAGVRRPGRVRVEPARARAIEAALADARPGDAVLIAGKGRQTFQIFADRAEPFDDAEVARRWLRTHRPGTRRSA
ncbi:MAG: cyanophycin synthetase [Isosphaeraceae bacterium]